nr:hypothetical protein SYMBAF_80090 [Serratia symbiotica]
MQNRRNDDYVTQIRPDPPFHITTLYIPEQLDSKHTEQKLHNKTKDYFLTYFYISQSPGGLRKKVTSVTCNKKTR